MLTPKEQRRLKMYHEDVAMPRRKYILMYVISCGILMPVLITLFEFIIDKKTLQQQWNEHLWTWYLIFPFIGILMGLFMRWMITKGLAKLKEKENQANQETFPSNQP